MDYILYAKRDILFFKELVKLPWNGPFRKLGLGRALYQKVFEYAENHAVPVVTAEIDTIPYNQASLSFHKTMGFRKVGEQFVRGGSVKVSLQAAEVKMQTSRLL